jgi:hypothetical protein
MNRRSAIFYYWLFKNKFGLPGRDLLRFLFKPNVKKIAEKFIKGIEDEENYKKITFNNFALPLYWPVEYPLSNLYQVVAETFDKNDWHYYEYKETGVAGRDVVVDIGAAEGLFSLVVVKKCQKIYLIEPNALFTQTLKKTFQNSIPERV